MGLISQVLIGFLAQSGIHLGKEGQVDGAVDAEDIPLPYVEFAYYELQKIGIDVILDLKSYDLSVSPLQS